MNFPHSVHRNAAKTVVGMDEAARLELALTHNYDTENSNRMTIHTDGKIRERAIFLYYPHYTIDNVYEYAVIKSTITYLNKLCRFPASKGFTLGHHIPVKAGGTHHMENWFIQTYKDNQSQGNTVPETPKMTFEEQKEYLKQNMPQLLDRDYFDVAVLLLLKYEEIYKATYPCQKEIG